jgi:hypothetical protein
MPPSGRASSCGPGTEVAGPRGPPISSRRAATLAALRQGSIMSERSPAGVHASSTDEPSALPGVSSFDDLPGEMAGASFEVQVAVPAEGESEDAGVGRIVEDRGGSHRGRSVEGQANRERGTSGLERSSACGPRTPTPSCSSTEVRSVRDLVAILNAGSPAHALRRGDSLRLHPHDPERVIIARVEELRALPSALQQEISRLASPSGASCVASTEASLLPAPSPEPGRRLRLLR